MLSTRKIVVNESQSLSYSTLCDACSSFFRRTDVTAVKVDHVTGKRKGKLWPRRQHVNKTTAIRVYFAASEGRDRSRNVRVQMSAGWGRI